MALILRAPGWTAKIPEMAWMAMILAVVILSLTFLPSWSLLFLILVGVIAREVLEVKHKEQARPDSPLAPNRQEWPIDIDFPAQAHARRVAQPSAADVATGIKTEDFKYDVFLNYKDSDTGQDFADRVYNLLVDVGITVFRDREELHLGEEIGDRLKKVIQQSTISIAILSPNYASSRPCLMELEQMLESRKKFPPQWIVPIFYNISPADVRYLLDDFGRSFNLHEIDKVDEERRQKWRMVLRHIGELSGFVKSWADGDDHLASVVVETVKRRLKKVNEIVLPEKLVDIDCPVRRMMEKLDVDYNYGQVTGVRGKKARVVGMYGAPGVVGKTTVAKIIYRKIYDLFDAFSFVEDISSKGVLSSQEKLIADLGNSKHPSIRSSYEGSEILANQFRDKRVLIVLDNVDKNEQMEALARELTWFGPGSRIIVTTNKKTILEVFDTGASDEGTVQVYEVEEMDHGHALQLFCELNFGKVLPEGFSVYDSLSEEIVKAIGGFPEKIERYASYFDGIMKRDMWKKTLNSLLKDGDAALQVNNARRSEPQNSIEDILAIWFQD